MKGTLFVFDFRYLAADEPLLFGRTGSLFSKVAGNDADKFQHRLDAFREHATYPPSAYERNGDVFEIANAIVLDDRQHLVSRSIRLDLSDPAKPTLEVRAPA